MRTCEVCGSTLDGNHPFVVCAKCLLGEALGIGTSEAAPEDFTLVGETSRGPQFKSLFGRRDFFEKYEILEQVEQGGQADVCKAWDFELRRCVAMKRLAGKALSSEAAVYRFLAEAQIASQLEHPGILPIFDVGLDPDGRPFYTTQLLPDAELARVWERVRDPADAAWNTERALELLVRVCGVMAYAHSRGVIHRDLKPANILVGPHGDVRVIDWGSAHVLPAARKNFEEPFVPLNRSAIETARAEAVWSALDSPWSTANAGLPVTILFTPPEILRGEPDQLGPQTDIYSLGVMLYDLLAGRAPYSGSDGQLPAPAELRERIKSAPPVPLRRLNPTVSRDLAAICEKAMARARSDRYCSMEELADDLRAALEVRPVKARKPGPILKLQRWSQRHIPHVMFGGLALFIAAVAFAVTRGLTAERDAARQVTALRNAELSARSGHWREALRYWDEAEAAGYNDSVHLNLQRAEAWTVLIEPQRSQALLTRLAKRSDLGSHEGEVLLRLGEHQLFDARTADEGVERVRAALAAGLTPADQAFAKGLLADSTPEALQFFKTALQLNPYHHGAHRHSLGLEFALGHHAELETHTRVFKILYPDDPTPGWLEAAGLALRGRSADARARLESLRNSANAELWQRLDAGLRGLAAMANACELDRYLASRETNRNALELFSADSASTLLSPSLPTVTTESGIRLPQLPSVRKGIIEGNDGMRSLLIPFLSDPNLAAQKVKSSWRHHPEALLPTMAGILLEQRRPPGESKPLPLLQLQAELFQLAADSPSVMPCLGRLSRFLAANSHFELNRNGGTDASIERQACLEIARRIAGVEETSALECSAYFDMAFELGDHGLARSLLDRWERLAPNDARAKRPRIQLDVATGAYASALRSLDEILAADPTDDWANDQKLRVVAALKQLLNSTSVPPQR